MLQARFPQWDGDTILIYVLLLAFIVLLSVLLKVKKAKIFGVSLLYSYIYSVLVTTLIMREVYPTVRYTLEITFVRQILIEHNKIALAEAVFNFLLIMPVGFFMPILIKKLPYIKTVLFGLLLTLFIEITQLVTHLGEFQTDDVILNFSGCLFGAAAMYVLDKIFKAHQKSKNNIHA